jgi:PHD/YefM family antitoxin component YafN of YafNO toxin-antitoxin module
MDALPRVVPITDLRKTSEISAICHEANGPVIITKNGYSDLVIMTVEAYERQMWEQSMPARLAVAEAELQAGAEGTPLKDVIAGQRKRIDG